MSVEHEAETSVIDIQPAAGTSCNSCLADTHISSVDVVTHARSEEIDWILEEAIRDAEDDKIVVLRHPELRDAFKRRYGNLIDHKWWLINEWMSNGLDWIEVISELEKVESDGEEEDKFAAV